MLTTQYYEELERIMTIRYIKKSKAMRTRKNFTRSLGKCLVLIKIRFAGDKVIRRNEDNYEQNIKMQ